MLFGVLSAKNAVLKGQPEQKIDDQLGAYSNLTEEAKTSVERANYLTTSMLTGKLRLIAELPVTQNTELTLPVKCRGKTAGLTVDQLIFWNVTNALGNYQTRRETLRTNDEKGWTAE